MNTTDWFVFIQQEHYFAPKCFADLLWLLPVHYGHNGPTVCETVHFNKKDILYYSINKWVFS
jgi:hypothetical protein